MHHPLELLALVPMELEPALLLAEEEAVVEELVLPSYRTRQTRALKQIRMFPTVKLFSCPL
jgi:hypothetical protein